MGPLEMKFFVILGILIGLKQADAINCYNCGVLDSSCHDPFKASGVPTITCFGSCMKVKAKDSSSNVQVVVRACYPTSAVEYKCTDTTYNGISSTVCYCNGNLCNYALSVGSSIMVMAAAMIIYIALH